MSLGTVVFHPKFSAEQWARFRGEKQGKGPLQPATFYPAIVGAVLVRLRKARGLTQAEIAGQLGLAPSTWSRIESGDSALTIDQLGQAARVLDVRAAEILERADDAQAVAEARQVRVEPGRIAGLEAARLGLMLVGASTLSALVREATIAPPTWRTGDEHEIQLSREETARWYADDVKTWAPCRRDGRLLVREEAQARGVVVSLLDVDGKLLACAGPPIHPAHEERS